MKEKCMCNICLQQTGYYITCDTCNGVGEIKNPFIEVKILDTNYDFCSLQCLLKFIVEELKKEKINA